MLQKSATRFSKSCQKISPNYQSIKKSPKLPKSPTRVRTTQTQTTRGTIYVNNTFQICPLGILWQVHMYLWTSFKWRYPLYTFPKSPFPISFLILMSDQCFTALAGNFLPKRLVNSFPINSERICKKYSFNWPWFVNQKLIITPQYITFVKTNRTIGAT